jgi:hypothetical protein
MRVNRLPTVNIVPVMSRRQGPVSFTIFPPERAAELEIRAVAAQSALDRRIVTDDSSASSLPLRPADAAKNRWPLRIQIKLWPCNAP